MKTSSGSKKPLKAGKKKKSEDNDAEAEIFSSKFNQEALRLSEENK